MAYEILPSEYDLLTRDVEYEAVAAFIKAQLDFRGIQTGIVLDLACGTGTMSYMLAKMGYEMIGVDASAEMLSVAYSKRTNEQTPMAPVFIHQDMRELDLYGTVDACICMLDSVNYITEPNDLRKVFSKVSLFMNPGGLLIFDINTPLKLREIDGFAFCDEKEEEGIFCIWRAALSDQPKIYQFIVDLFIRNQNGKTRESWRRGSEEHYEYAYETQELAEMLLDAGFENVRMYGGTDGSTLTGDEKRIYFTADKPTS